MDPHINLDGSVFHKHCAKCKDCKCQITLSNFNKNVSGNVTYLLCKTHFFQRFNEVSQYEAFQVTCFMSTIYMKSELQN